MFWIKVRKAPSLYHQQNLYIFKIFITNTEKKKVYILVRQGSLDFSNNQDKEIYS